MDGQVSRAPWTAQKRPGSYATSKNQQSVPLILGGARWT